MNIAPLILLIQSVISLLVNIQSAPLAQRQAVTQLANQVLIVANETANSLTATATVPIATATTTAVTTTTATQGQMPNYYSPNYTPPPLYGPVIIIQP